MRILGPALIGLSLWLLAAVVIVVVLVRRLRERSATPLPAGTGLTEAAVRTYVSRRRAPPQHQLVLRPRPATRAGRRGRRCHPCSSLRH
jgi:hypothetical protein